MTGPRPFHRLFGLSWSDLFQGSDVAVELEMDLSRRQQLLDLVLIRRGPSPITRPLPDGFEDLAPHNLVTFKSHQESLDGWTLAELIGHSVNYRKQAAPSQQEVLPESDVRLYAVCVRFPQNLENVGILLPVREGVYNVIFPAVATIRVIVVHRLPQKEHNAMLLLFSQMAEPFLYANRNFRRRSAETSSLLLKLLLIHHEDPDMATQLEEFYRETIDELLRELPPDELRRYLPPEERLKGLPPEERLKGMPPEELRKWLSPEERVEGLTAEERLKGLTPEELRKVLDSLQRSLGKNGSSPEQN